MTYEGDALQAHRVEPHLLWSQETLPRRHVISAAL